MTKTIFITDYAWPDLDVERALIEDAGHRLVHANPEALPAAEIERLAREYRPQAVMTVWAHVSARAIEACRDLEIVARVGVGLDNIDVGAATAAGAVVTNVPDYCAEEVSDHACALLLSWGRGTVFCNRDVRGGIWNPALARLRRMRTLCVGIAGYGRTGELVAQKLHGYGLRVLAHRRHWPGPAPAHVTAVGFDELLARSDAVIALMPLSAETRGIFGARAFAAMKPGSLIINVSRGGLVDNSALLAALDAGHLDAAALDVIDGEPSPPVAVTLHPRVICTPHVAFSSPTAIAELRQRSTEEVLRVFRGEPPRNLCAAPARRRA